MSHECGPDCTSELHEPIITPTGYDGYGSPLYEHQLQTGVSDADDHIR